MRQILNIKLTIQKRPYLAIKEPPDTIGFTSRPLKLQVSRDIVIRMSFKKFKFHYENKITFC